MATQRLRTIKASGGNYTTLSAAEAGEQGNLVSADEYVVLEGDAITVGNTTFAGWTTDGTRYAHVRAAAGQRHNGVSGGFTVTTSNYGYCLNVQIEDLIAEGLYLAAGTPNPIGTVSVNGAAARRLTFRDLLVTGGTTYGGIRVEDATSGYINVINCVGYFGASGLPLIRAKDGSGYTVRVYNCTGFTTATSGDYLFWNGAGVTFIAKNCISEYGGTYNGFNGTISGNNNVSSASSVPGTSGTTSSRCDFVDDSIGDLRLTGSDTIARDTGADLSGDADYPFNTDILGNSRGTGGSWDRGAFEQGAGGGGGGVSLVAVERGRAMGRGLLRGFA